MASCSSADSLGLPVSPAMRCSILSTVVIYAKVDESCFCTVTNAVAVLKSGMLADDDIVTWTFAGMVYVNTALFISVIAPVDPPINGETDRLPIELPLTKILM